MVNLQSELFDQSVYATTVTEVAALKPKKKAQKPRPLDIASITLDFIKSLPSVALRDRRNLPMTAGIYFAFIEIPGDIKIAYIGMSSCFTTRWLQHDKLPELCFVEKLGVPVKIAWLELEWGKHDIDLMEVALIKKFQPSLNITHATVEAPKRSIAAVIEVDEFTKKRIADGLSYALESLNTSELQAIAISLGLRISRSYSKDYKIEEIKAALGNFYNPNLPYRLKEKTDRKWTRRVSHDKNLIRAVLATVKQPLEELSIRQLKRIAGSLGVYQYSHLLKEELITEILRQESYLDE
jgi:hypothetical protein